MRIVLYIPLKVIFLYTIFCEIQGLEGETKYHKDDCLFRGVRNYINM